MARMAKRALVGLLAGVGVLAALVIVLEGGASWLLLAHDFLAAQAPRYYRPHTTYDTLLGWANRPSFSSPDEYGPGIGVSTNALGLRGSRVIDIGDTSRTRLVCSGDSVTLGYGVDDEHTWCGLLESYFPGLETLNMGQAAYGLDQAYLWYRRDGARVRHQVQIFAMISVMFDRSTTATYRGRFKPYLVVKDGRLETTHVPVPPQTQSALNLGYAMRTLDDLRLMHFSRKVPALDGTRRAADLVDRDWPMFEAVFSELAAYDRAHGVELVLAYLPFPDDIPHGPIDARRARIASYAAAHQIRFIDLTPELRAMRTDSLDRLTITHVAPNVAPGIPGHYSNLGNEWAAKLLAEKLADVAPLASLRAKAHAPTQTKRQGP